MMTDEKEEIKEEPKEEEVTPTFLEQVKQEREAMEKLRDEIKAERAEIQELKATEILSGKANAGETEEKKEEETPEEYGKRALEGKIEG